MSERIQYELVDIQVTTSGSFNIKMISKANPKYAHFLFDFQNIVLQTSEGELGVWYDFNPAYIGNNRPTLSKEDLSDLKEFGESILQQFFLDQQTIHDSGIGIEEVIQQVAKRKVDFEASLPYNQNTHPGDDL